MPEGPVEKNRAHLLARRKKKRKERRPRPDPQVMAANQLTVDELSRLSRAGLVHIDSPSPEQMEFARANAPVPSWAIRY